MALEPAFGFVEIEAALGDFEVAAGLPFGEERGFHCGKGGGDHSGGSSKRRGSRKVKLILKRVERGAMVGSVR